LNAVGLNVTLGASVTAALVSQCFQQLSSGPFFTFLVQVIFEWIEIMQHASTIILEKRRRLLVLNIVISASFNLFSVIAGIVTILYGLQLIRSELSTVFAVIFYVVIIVAFAGMAITFAFYGKRIISILKSFETTDKIALAIRRMTIVVLICIICWSVRVISLVWLAAVPLAISDVGAQRYRKIFFTYLPELVVCVFIHVLYARAAANQGVESHPSATSATNSKRNSGTELEQKSSA